MKYTGIVDLELKRGYEVLWSTSQHNGALMGLRTAFANMLTGLKTNDYIPKYIVGNANGVLSEQVEITGLNKQVLPIEIGGQMISIPCINVNAIIPITDSFSATMATSPTTKYILKSNKENLAEMTIQNVGESISEEIANLTPGLQLNIRWRLYLED